MYYIHVIWRVWDLDHQSPIERESVCVCVCVCVVRKREGESGRDREVKQETH